MMKKSDLKWKCPRDLERQLCGLTEPRRLLKAMSTYAERKAVGTEAEISRVFTGRQVNKKLGFDFLKGKIMTEKINLQKNQAKDLFGFLNDAWDLVC